jgi:hypothetical protein
LGSQLWGLDFHTRGFQDWNLKTFRTWFSGCGISILRPGFHTGGFTVAVGHGHPLVPFNCCDRRLWQKERPLLGLVSFLVFRPFPCTTCFILLVMGLGLRFHEFSS